MILATGEGWLERGSQQWGQVQALGGVVGVRQKDKE